MKNFNNTILVTGASGFLGSHIAEELLAQGYNVIGTKRTQTDLRRTKNFAEKIHWLNVDDVQWQQYAVELNPAIIIHSAWSGVSAANRMDWDSQIGNLDILGDLLHISEKVDLKMFIAFGSQAEYGIFDGKIDESYPTNPNTAYGTMKLMAYNLVKGFFNSQKSKRAKWYWLRLFSFFGEREDNQWLIPSTILKLSSDSEIDFTGGEQKYAYLYVKDLTQMIITLILSEAESGVYNISSTKPLAIRYLIEQIKTMIGSKSKLNFGVLPYRPGQSMHIEGDMTKFIEQAKPFHESDLKDSLQKTIDSINSQDGRNK